MKRVLTFLIWFLIFGKAFGQIDFGGSYHMAAICKDGILVATDSRGVFLKRDSAIANFDTVQKVFIIKNCAISIVGLIALGGRFISSYLNEFESDLPDNLTPPELLNKLNNYFLSHYQQFKPDYLRLHIICIGYTHDTALICGMDKGIGSCSFGDGVATGDSLSDLTINHYDYNYFILKTCKEATKIFESAMKHYPTQSGRSFEVGGPTMMIKVTPNNKVEWVENKPNKPNWNYISEVIEEYKAGTVKINFLSDYYKKVVENYYHITSLY